MLVKLKTKTSGWLAIGFNPKYAMKNSTMIIGYIGEKGPVIREDFGISAHKHKSISSLGGSYTVKLVDGNYSNGWSNLEFKMPLNSTDLKYGAKIKLDEINKLIFAYGKDGDKNFFSYHDYRTSVNIKIDSTC